LGKHCCAEINPTTCYRGFEIGKDGREKRNDFGV
jgi:hypothetical protein